MPYYLEVTVMVGPGLQYWMQIACNIIRVLSVASLRCCSVPRSDIMCHSGPIFDSLVTDLVAMCCVNISFL